MSWRNAEFTKVVVTFMMGKMVGIFGVVIFAYTSHTIYFVGTYGTYSVFE